MADTARGSFPDEICLDCGELGCSFKHWGSLVPDGKLGYFCLFCFFRREKMGAVPLGAKPPGIPDEFTGKDLEVVTQKSAYSLTLCDQPEERNVSSNEQVELGFSRARVMSLIIGESLFLKPRDCKDFDLFRTTPVVLIKPR